MFNISTARKLFTEAGATIHMQARARMAFTVVGAPGVNASVLAASIMDLAFINICKGRREKKRKTEAGRRTERQERNECNLTKSSHYEKKLVTRKKAQMSFQAAKGI